MFLDYVLRRPSVIELDDPALVVLRRRLFSGELRDESLEYVAHVVLRLLLKQSMIDRGIALHIFLDEQDDCVRFSLYQPVDDVYREGEWIGRDWSIQDAADDDLMDENDETLSFVDFMDAAAERVAKKRAARGPMDYDSVPRTWVQVFPVPGYLAPDMFKHIRRYARMRDSDSQGKLRLRYQGEVTECTISVRRVDDFRVYFGGERPTIRPKTREQLAEVEREPGAKGKGNKRGSP